MTTNQNKITVESIVEDGEKILDEYYQHRLAMHEGRGYMHSVVDKRVFQEFIRSRFTAMLLVITSDN